MTDSPQHHPLLHTVDCVRLYVPDLEAGLAFYRHALRHELIWRMEHALGLRMPGTKPMPRGT